MLIIEQLEAGFLASAEQLFRPKKKKKIHLKVNDKV